MSNQVRMSVGQWIIAEKGDDFAAARVYAMDDDCDTASVEFIGGYRTLVWAANPDARVFDTSEAAIMALAADEH